VRSWGSGWVEGDVDLKFGRSIGGRRGADLTEIVRSERLRFACGKVRLACAGKNSCVRNFNETIWRHPGCKGYGPRNH
jgi:hypothetical protein